MSAGKTDPLEAPFLELPPVIVEAFQVARAAFMDSPRFLCSHLENGGRVALACAQHPRLGLMDPGCFRQHLHRHDDVSEFVCDVCLRVSTEIAGVTLEMKFANLTTRRTNGRRRLFTGIVFMGGLGLCSGCAMAEAA